MVEYSPNLDAVFGALSDGTRRDILERLMRGDLVISDLAGRYQLSFAAVAKHVTVLEKAGLVTKAKQGRQQVVRGNAEVLGQTARFLDAYEALWVQRFQRLDDLLQEE